MPCLEGVLCDSAAMQTHRHSGMLNINKVKRFSHLRWTDWNQPKKQFLFGKVSASNVISYWCGVRRKAGFIMCTDT